MVEMRDSLLFVYGTLRPVAAVPLARWLAERARYLGPARTRGRLYDLGDYPGWCPPRSARDWVAGDLYFLPRSAAMLRALDRYEAGPRGRAGALFERRRAAVELARGGLAAKRCGAWLYAYRRAVRPCNRITSGDFRDRLRRGSL